MVPGAGDQLRLGPRQLGAAPALHELQVPHGAVAVVVPAAEVEVRHLHLPVDLVEAPGPAVRVLEPVPGVLRQTRRQVPRQVEPGQVLDPGGLAVGLVPRPPGLGRRVRRRQSPPAAQVRRHGGEPPLDAPPRPEAARPVDLGQLQGDGVGAHRLQVRRPQPGQLPLHPGVVRGPEGAHPAVAPRLRRQPLHGIVPVLGVPRALHGEGHPVALGAVAAPRVHGDDRVPGAHVALVPALRAAVRRAVQDCREGAPGVGAEDVGLHARAVPHRHAHVGLGEDPEGAGHRARSVSVAIAFMSRPPCSWQLCRRLISRWRAPPLHALPAR